MKLFISDLDGTLLGPDHDVSPGNLAAIRELEAAGVTFAVATGRAYNDAEAILARHGLRCPVICSNGACVRSAQGELLHKTTLPLPTLEKLCRFMEEQNIFFAINSPLAIHALRGWEDILLGELEQSSQERFRENRDTFLSQYGVIYPDNFDEFLTGRQDCCSLSVISLDSKKLGRLTKFIDADGCAMLTMSGFNSLEILCKGSTKADALRRLAEHMGIPLTETCAVGDNYNDLEMLQTAGVSFAMGNAPEEIQRNSVYVTEANDRDGVGLAIRKMLTA